MIKLARPNEIPDLKAAGYRDDGPSTRFPGFHMMVLTPVEAPIVPDDEFNHLVTACASLETRND